MCRRVLRGLLPHFCGFLFLLQFINVSRVSEPFPLFYKHLGQNDDEDYGREVAVALLSLNSLKNIYKP